MTDCSTCLGVDENLGDDDDDVKQLYRHLRQLLALPLRKEWPSTSRSSASSTALSLYSALTEAYTDDDEATGGLIPANFRQALQPLSNFIARCTGSDMHATALQTAFLATDADHAEEECIIMSFLCLEVACVALDKAPPVDPATKSIPRPRRWQSICFETIRLYQSQLSEHFGVLRSLHQQQQPSAWCGLQEWILLWIDIVLPCTRRLQDKLASSTCAMGMAYKAGVAATCSILARATMMSATLSALDNQHEREADQLLDTLLDATMTVVSKTDDAILWFADTNQRQSLAKDNDDASLSYWLQQDGAEEVAGMRTSVDDLGWAVMVTCAFRRRPLETSDLGSATGATKTALRESCLEWIVHVSTLLAISLDDFMDADEYNVPGQSLLLAEAASDRFHALGLILLEEILKFITVKTLPVSWGEAHGYHPSTFARPSPVLGTMQLLANRIARSAMVRDGDNISLATFRSRQAFALMQKMISVHRPEAQVDMVRRLLATCPYRQLQPKIFDLLRNAIDWTHDDTNAMQALWQYIDKSFVTELEAHVSVRFGDDLQALLDEPGDLIESFELYDAALNLFYLWANVKKIRPDIPNLQSRLTKIHKVLGTSLKSWSQGDETPDQWFRLELLNMSLQKVVEQLSVLSLKNQH